MSMQMKHNITNVKVTVRWSKNDPGEAPYPVIDIEFEQLVEDYKDSNRNPVTTSEMITLFLDKTSRPEFRVVDVEGFNPTYTYSEDSNEGVPDDMVLTLKEYVDHEVKFPQEVKELTN